MNLLVDAMRFYIGTIFTIVVKDQKKLKSIYLKTISYGEGIGI